MTRASLDMQLLSADAQCLDGFLGFLVGVKIHAIGEWKPHEVLKLAGVEDEYLMVG